MELFEFTRLEMGQWGRRGPPHPRQPGSSVLITLLPAPALRAISRLPKVTGDNAGAAIQTPAPLVPTAWLFPSRTVFPRLCLFAFCLIPGNWLLCP